MDENGQNNLDQILNRFDDVYFWYQEAIDDYKHLYYTDNVINVTGYSRDELLAMPGRGKDIIVDEDLKKLKPRIADFKNDPQKKSISIEFRLVRKDSRVTWVNEKILVERNEEGKIIKSFGKVCNLSEFKEKELKLIKEKDELINLNSSKDDFIAMLSHDLRAPFTSILGFSEILLNESNLSDSDKAEYLSYINDSSQNQLYLINDLLDWSRLQTGKFKIEVQRIHAQSLIFNCVSSLTGNAVRKNIDIKVDIPETLYINADERMIMQVVVNLLNNAIKFSPEQTTVEIKANIFNDELAEFIIKDNGIGIPEDSKSKLFKIGRMYSTEGTKGEKGTGLGLALAKQIIEKHGGEIWFYSKPEEGSEFHFTVPFSANAVLIVKIDEQSKEEYLNLFKEKFSQYKLLTAKNGYEALGIIISQMPSLIIIDHEMPLMNGVQLAKTLRGGDKPLNIPIFVRTNEQAEDILNVYKKLNVKILEDNYLELDEFGEELSTILK